MYVCMYIHTYNGVSIHAHKGGVGGMGTTQSTGMARQLSFFETNDKETIQMGLTALQDLIF